MDDMEQLEVLRAALAVAVADGELRNSEMGVIKGLAARVGVGQVSFDAMVAAAKRGEQLPTLSLLESGSEARKALELLVGQARIDGEISKEERGVLVEIASRLNITGDDFVKVYEAGIARADAVRRSRGLA